MSDLAQEIPGVLHACLLDGRGGATPVEGQALLQWRAEQGALWIHLGAGMELKHPWMGQHSGLKPNQAAFLLQEEGRPRLIFHPGGFLITLRGINHQEGARPEDMVFINAWVEPGRILTYCTRPVMAVEDLREESRQGLGPRDSGDLLLRLAEHLIWRMEPVLDDLSTRLDLLEERLTLESPQASRKELGGLRRLVIRLHLHLEPQRTVLQALLHHRQGAGEPREDKKTLQEVVEQLAGYLERLDAYREHAGVIRDELESRTSQQMNQALYILSLISGLLLPMGLLTGLLGINVGGMPGAENEWAFWVVCGVLVVIGGGMALLFKRMKFI